MIIMIIIIAIPPNVILFYDIITLYKVSFIIINISAKTVHCFYDISCKFVSGSLSFFISLNRIHVTNTWCCRTTSILSYGIMQLCWHEDKVYRPDC